jgi:hypothetical protein
VREEIMPKPRRRHQARAAGAFGRSRPASVTAAGVLSDDTKSAIADAVHQAVCEYFQTDDPVGMCWQYNAVGAILASVVTHQPGAPASPMYAVQAGTLMLQPRPESDPEHWFAFDARDDGGARGEFHVWFVRIPAGAQPGQMIEDRDGTAEMVDLAARFYPQWAAMTGEWENPTPPYIWAPRRELPSWVRFQVDPAATTAVLAPGGNPQREAITRRAAEIF